MHPEFSPMMRTQWACATFAGDGVQAPHETQNPGSEGQEKEQPITPRGQCWVRLPE
jgi:hypothetical protein